MITIHDLITSTGILTTLLIIGSLLLTRAWKREKKEELHKYITGIVFAFTTDGGDWLHREPNGAPRPKIFS